MIPNFREQEFLLFISLSTGVTIAPAAPKGRTFSVDFFLYLTASEGRLRRPKGALGALSTYDSVYQGTLLTPMIQYIEARAPLVSMIRYMEGAPGAYDSIYRGEGAPRIYDSIYGGHPWCL